MTRRLAAYPARTRIVGAASRGLLDAGRATGGGKPLDGAARAWLGAKFSHDFSGVRVHTEGEAAQSAARMGADAYTSANRIVFAPGRYAPRTPEGRGLLAHELAHVVQQSRGTAHPEAVSHPGDADEAAARRAVSGLAAGRGPDLGAAQAGLHRQLAGAPPALLPALLPIGTQQSRSEILLESFLNRMWDAQSKKGLPFRITTKVREGLALLFPLGPPLGVITDFPSTAPVFEQLRGHLPATVDDPSVAVLDRLPAQEQALPARPASPAAGPATPAFPDKAPAMPPVWAPRQPLPKGTEADKAAGKALEAAFAQFRGTAIGQELEKAVKSYVFSKEGIPLVILVAANTLTFVAANDPELPATPDIPLGDGITLKLELSRVSDLPPLLNQLVKGTTEPATVPERKATAQVTFTFDALGEATLAVGRFFAEAATWIARGAVRARTVVGQAARSVLPELAATAGGAALGAVVGGVAGGGVGAAVGALVGAGLGLGAALVKRLID